MTFDRVRTYIAKHLSSSRAQHVFAVERLMVDEAERWGLPLAQAQLAALGHDLARELPPSVLLWVAELAALPIEPWERERPLLLHGKIGAMLLRRLVDQVDPAVEQAIADHTLGSPTMSVLGQLLYCADYLEPHRTHLGESARTSLLNLPLRERFVSVARQSLGYHRRRSHLLPPSRELWEVLCA